MPKKKENKEQITHTAEDAKGIMMRLKVGEIWHTSDGSWWTEQADAVAHKGENENITIEYFKMRRF